VAWKFVGRFAQPPETPGAYLFDWSGNYVTVRFQNTTKLTVKLQLLGAIPRDQMFAFAVDDLPPTTRRITVKNNAAGEPTNEPLEDYDITGLAPNVAHEVTIYKNTEAQKGSILFKGFELNGGELLAPTRRARRMEFIGDSIMCGYGNEGKNATCPFEVKVRNARDQNGQEVRDEKNEVVPVTVPLTENQYLSFTALTARELDADAVTICWSGKGVYKNYKERFIPDPANPGQSKPEDDTFTTIPEFWDTRTIGNDFQGYKWDWAAEKPEDVPQVVVISLGTNDFARDTKEPAPPGKLSGNNIPDGDLNDPNERQKFFEKYLAHVKNVRLHRPAAHIFIATPPMITDQFPLDNARRYTRDTLLRIVSELGATGDRKVYQMDLVEQGFRYGLGCDYHPNLEVHRIMAKQLVGAVRSKTCW
jgi:lysophospholipase L1-like esterase